MQMLHIIGEIVQGQVAQSPTPVQQITASAPHEQLTMLDLLFKGGLFIIPLLLFSVVAIYIIIERFVQIHKMAKMDPRIISDVHANLLKGELEPAIATLKENKNGYSFIFLPALYRVGQSVEEIERAVETSSSIYRTKMSKSLSYLGLIARISPMLGFIGSISGIVKIFYNISITGDLSIGGISAGLYEKMISSGLGITVGVVAYTGYHLLSNSVESFIEKIEIEAFDLINVIQGIPRHKS